MNTELLLKVKDAILKEPKRIAMSTWGIDSSTAPCGTIGCIYGWAEAISTGLRGKEFAEHVVAMLNGRIGPNGFPIPNNNPLDLTPEQEDRLYFKQKWPMKYKMALHADEEQTPEYAQVVADRIDHFIQTEGKE